jgi:hypothetical protein
MEPSDEVKPDHHDSATTRPSGHTRKASPNLVLTLLGVMLLAALVAITLRGRSLRAPDEDEIRALKAEIGAAEAEINARRAAMGLRPMEGTAEPVGQVAKRMQRDAETMVALANTFRNSLMEKEAVLSSKNEEILRGEQIRKSLGIEVERLRHELAKALAGNSQTESLQREAESLRSQRDTLSAEIQRLRGELETRGNVTNGDVETLKRQLDEAVRAKEFFEAKAKQLEQQAEQ